jgi:hypothetical protein
LLGHRRASADAPQHSDPARRKLHECIVAPREEKVSGLDRNFGCGEKLIEATNGFKIFTICRLPYVRADTQRKGEAGTVQQEASVVFSVPKAENEAASLHWENRSERKPWGVEHRNVTVAAEITRIECQDSGDTVRLHDRGKAGIVDFRAFHRMRDDQPPPLAKRLRWIRRHGENISIRDVSLSVAAIEFPSPFASSGRVHTFQNSAMFW